MKTTCYTLDRALISVFFFLQTDGETLPSCRDLRPVDVSMESSLEKQEPVGFPGKIYQGSPDHRIKDRQIKDQFKMNQIN